MILQDADILRILKDNPAKTTLDEARKKALLLNTHITGQDMKNVITMMDYFEDDQKKNLRQKYARSNVDLFGRLHRPIDKVFRAKGGSIVYNMPRVAQQEFTAYLGQIRNGMNLRKWIQMVALPAFEIDPMGIVFMEIEAQPGANGRQQPYPTYKSTNDIYDYELNGRHLEYVFFKLSKSQCKNFVSQGVDLPEPTASKLIEKLGLEDNKSRYYRVVDDVSDRIFEWAGGDAKPVEMGELTLPNYFMKVPAIIISDIVAYNTDEFISPDSQVVELANDFLTDVSVFNIWKKLHGFPKPWRYRSVCSTCMGATLVQGKMCPDCHGTGYRKNSTPRDEMVIPMPEEGGPKMPDVFGGYITPDIEGWNLMTEEMERLECMMFFTLYGTTQTGKANGPKSGDKGGGTQTATEDLNDLQSMIDRLEDFREWGQSIEFFITNMAGELMYGTAYQGSSVNWGNRFLLESPDTIWDKYNRARTAGAPQATLDGLLRDYYESRYATSPMDLQKALKLMRVEPFTHLTSQQVGLLAYVTQSDKVAKSYFGEWVSTMVDMDIILQDEQVLRDSLIEYSQEKADELKEDQQAQASLQAAAKGSITEDVKGAGVTGKETAVAA